MAPRGHIAGHWTSEGARPSRCENHIRAVCGLPLGAVDLVASRVEMVNLIGGDVHDWLTTLADPNAHLHLYGKGEARPGRKMGHVTRMEFCAEARSEEHTSELQSLMRITYAVFCLKKKTKHNTY